MIVDRSVPGLGKRDSLHRALSASRAVRSCTLGATCATSGALVPRCGPCSGPPAHPVHRAAGSSSWVQDCRVPVPPFPASSFPAPLPPPSHASRAGRHPRPRSDGTDTTRRRLPTAPRRRDQRRPAIGIPQMGRGRSCQGGKRGRGDLAGVDRSISMNMDGAQKLTNTLPMAADGRAPSSRGWTCTRTSQQLVNILMLANTSTSSGPRWMWMA